MKIVRNKPASRFGEALPLGNGHMGFMVYGRVGRDEIALSENTFYSGETSSHNNQPGAPQAFRQMREECQAGQFEQAKETAKGFIGVRENYGTNLPVGKLVIEIGDEAAGGAGAQEEYECSLDIRKAVVNCRYRQEGNLIEKTVFTSHPDRVGVHHITAGQPVNVRIWFEPTNRYGRSMAAESGLQLFAHAREEIHSDGSSGVKLSGTVCLKTDGQQGYDEKAGSILVAGATFITCYIGLATDFTVRSGEQAEQTAFRAAMAARELPLEVLQSRHEEDMKSLYDRVSLTIESEDEDCSSQIPLLFQYGRYLLYSSSREDSRLPAHLQGIWNDNVACRIGWTCDMHLDINTQMNYWPSQITGLPEINQPLFSWISNELVENGRQTARESYGLKGWVAELVSNCWGFAAPYWAASIAPCPTGGVWIMTHMWEQYLYTLDLKYLEEVAFPVMAEAAEFFVDYVFLGDDGYFGSGPSISPENSFVAEGSIYQISNSCTYEILLIRELFLEYRRAYEVLYGQVSAERLSQRQQVESGSRNHPELYERCGQILEKLVPYRINEDGTLAEWSHDYQAADPQHRHTSHLLGLFPFAQITPDGTPALAQAAGKTIAARLISEENWEDTGWARSMLLLYSARLKDGEAALRHIKCMLGGLLEENGMIIHPPTRGAPSFDNVYELDGNTGLTAGIAEMLLQSHNGIIQLLPALPEAWQSGRIKGLRARGGIRIDMAWQNGRLIEAVLSAEKELPYQVRYEGKEFGGILQKASDGEYYVDLIK